jgi:KilA-N domain
MNIPTEYKNLSTIAKASGKRLDSWVNYPVGKKAIVDFNLKYPEIEQPLVTKKGKGGGTWAHPELAAIFAAWCNPTFTAEVVEQNVQLKEQNALLKEKIRTFQVNTPAQIAAVRDEAEKVKQMAYKVKEKTEAEIELIAKCHFVQNAGVHPKGITFEQYLPHWLFSMRERTDGVNIYSPAILDAMLAKTGQPARCQGKVLKPGYAGVWVAEIN